METEEEEMMTLNRTMTNLAPDDKHSMRRTTGLKTTLRRYIVITTLHPGSYTSGISPHIQHRKYETPGHEAHETFEQ